MKESIAVTNVATGCTFASSRSLVKTNCVLIALLLLPTAAFAEKPPISGTSKPEFAPVDEAALEFRTSIACDALTVAISKDGKLLYARGFGWRDAKHKLPAQSSTLIRIASVTKPFTEAAVRKLVREQKLTYDTKAFEFLKLSPPSSAKEDPRLKEITVQMLLDHKGGWDRNKAFDPMFATQKIEKSLGLKHPARPADVIRYMLGQQLQFDPGSRSEYSNFGYCVLGRVVEKASGKTYFNYVREEILQPIGITDIKLAHDAVKNRDPEEAYYPAEVLVQVMDSHGGLIAAAPALCTFMDHYWINGEPRHPNQRGTWTFFGSLPGTTSMVHQRPDGFNIAVLCNNRRDKSFDADNTALLKLMDQALDQLDKPEAK